VAACNASFRSPDYLSEMETMSEAGRARSARPRLRVAGKDDDVTLRDVEVCTEVLTRLLSSESNRVAWLMGFLVGSQLGATEANLT